MKQNRVETTLVRQTVYLQRLRVIGHSTYGSAVCLHEVSQPSVYHWDTATLDLAALKGGSYYRKVDDMCGSVV